MHFISESAWLDETWLRRSWEDAERWHWANDTKLRANPLYSRSRSHVSGWNTVSNGCGHACSGECDRGARWRPFSL